MGIGHRLRAYCLGRLGLFNILIKLFRVRLDIRVYKGNEIENHVINMTK